MLLRKSVGTDSKDITVDMGVILSNGGIFQNSAHPATKRNTRKANLIFIISVYISAHCLSCISLTRLGYGASTTVKSG